MIQRRSRRACCATRCLKALWRITERTSIPVPQSTMRRFITWGLLKIADVEYVYYTTDHDITPNTLYSVLAINSSTPDDQVDSKNMVNVLYKHVAGHQLEYQIEDSAGQSRHASRWLDREQSLWRRQSPACAVGRGEAFRHCPREHSPRLHRHPQGGVRISKRFDRCAYGGAYKLQR